MKKEMEIRLTDQERNAALTLYQSLGIPENEIEHDYEIDYLTVNTGRDDNDYVWYFDGSVGGAISVDNMRILTDEEIENLLL